MFITCLYRYRPDNFWPAGKHSAETVPSCFSSRFSSCWHLLEFGQPLQVRLFSSKKWMAWNKGTTRMYSQHPYQSVCFLLCPLNEEETCLPEVVTAPQPLLAGHRHPQTHCRFAQSSEHHVCRVLHHYRCSALCLFQMSMMVTDWFLCQLSC